jgi:hypothetical protein
MPFRRPSTQPAAPIDQAGDARTGAADDRGPKGRRRAGWAWLAGADGYVLRRVPSEAGFLDALGMWVAGMAIVSGFAMTVAASQWWSTSIVSVLWVLPLWAALYCLIERLVLKSFGTKWAWNVVLAVPRLLLSLAIALVVGLPMSQVIYSGSINDQLSRTTTARIHEATNEITQQYGAKIAAARKEIATAERKEASLQKQVTQAKFLAGCEIGVADCSETHKLGCGPYCKRDLRRAAAAAAALERARPELEATIAAAQRSITRWRATESAQIANRVAAIKADRDFLSRQAALEQVQRDNPAVRKYVEFFLLFLIAIDLVAIVLKLTHLLSTGGAYEKHAAALRSMDVVDAHRLQEHADVLTRRISLEAQAQRAADERTFLGEAAQSEVEPEPSERPSRGSWPARTATVQPVTE